MQACCHILIEKRPCLPSIAWWMNESKIAKRLDLRFVEFLPITLPRLMSLFPPLCHLPAFCPPTTYPLHFYAAERQTERRLRLMILSRDLLCKVVQMKSKFPPEAAARSPLILTRHLCSLSISGASFGLSRTIERGEGGFNSNVV